MFQLTHPLPRKYWIAVSGGVDSMAALHWLDKQSRRDSLLGVLHVNHNTGEFANIAEEHVNNHCYFEDITLKRLRLDSEPPKGESKEKWWRDRRYEFFKSFNDPVILAHNFDDCLEEYIMCTMVRGYSSTIPYSNGNCVRPFRLWKRSSIEEYAIKNNLKWVEDPSNTNTKHKRNYIRHVLVPQLLELNPGLYNIVRKVIDK
jgi:tRNA(Ile)-lysidine synthase